MNELESRRGERDKVETKKQKQPRAHAHDECLRAIMRKKSRCQTEREKGETSQMRDVEMPAGAVGDQDVPVGTMAVGDLVDLHVRRQDIDDHAIA